MLADLSASDLDFLDGIRTGLSANEYARRHNYSLDWAKWKSKRIRAKLEVATIQEALVMSEITRGDLDSLRREFTTAIENLAKAVTPSERETAREDVKNTGTDLTTELRLRGLSMKDLDLFAEEKRQRQIDSSVAAALKQRDDEAEAKRKADEAAAAASGENGEGGSLGDKIRDGLGGKTWGAKT